MKTMLKAIGPEYAAFLVTCVWGAGLSAGDTARVPASVTPLRLHWMLPGRSRPPHSLPDAPPRPLPACLALAGAAARAIADDFSAIFLCAQRPRRASNTLAGAWLLEPGRVSFMFDEGIRL